MTIMRPGEILGAVWVVDRELGKGGMGTVYACRHRENGTIAAVKTISLPSSQARRDVVQSRLEREVRALKRLAEDPGVVGGLGLEVDVERGVFVFVMELVGGEPLTSAWLRARPGAVGANVLAVVREVAATLGRVHALGVEHRDVKPQNILMRYLASGEVRPVLVDWGSVHLGDEPSKTTAWRSHGLGITQTYAPPDAILNPAVQETKAWDVYSLAVTAFVLLTGDEDPFELGDSGDGENAVQAKAVGLSLPEALDVPDALRDFVYWGTRATLRDRLATMEEAIQVLDVGRGVRLGSARRRPSEGPTATFEIPSEDTTVEPGMTAKSAKSRRPLAMGGLGLAFLCAAVAVLLLADGTVNGTVLESSVDRAFLVSSASKATPVLEDVASGEAPTGRAEFASVPATDHGAPREGKFPAQGQPEASPLEHGHRLSGSDENPAPGADGTSVPPPVSLPSASLTEIALRSYVNDSQWVATAMDAWKAGAADADQHDAARASFVQVMGTVDRNVGLAQRMYATLGALDRLPDLYDLNRALRTNVSPPDPVVQSLLDTPPGWAVPPVDAGACARLHGLLDLVGQSTRAPAGSDWRCRACSECTKLGAPTPKCEDFDENRCK